MPQTIEQGDIFGRIGKAFGEGAGGGALKQLGANRVAKALKPEEGKPFNALETTQKLIKAQATPQEISQYVPLIQQEQQRQEFLNRNKPNVGQPSNLPSQETIGGAKPLSSFKNFQPLQGTTEALENRASELIASQPSLYRDPAKAMEKAQTEYQNQQTILNKTSDDFDKVVQKRLQKYGKEIDQAIFGDMQQDYLREAQAIAATGKMSPEKAVDKLSKDLLDFAKARTNLKGLMITSLASTIPKKAEQSKLNAIRKEYEDKDQLELFENDLINEQGLSTGIASYLAFPVRGNKEINNFAQDTKKKSSNLFGPIIAGLKEKGGKGTKKRNEQEIADFIVQNLKDSDSLNSIATVFNAKGYDANKILDSIQKKWDEGKSLNKRQQQDLQKRPSFRPTLRDIAYFSATGLEPQEIIP